MTKITTKPENTKTTYTIQTLSREHMQSTADLFIKTFCDHEPITKHLGIQYHEYEPFALSVIQKAVKDGLSVVAVDTKTNRVVACTIAEDMTDLFQPNLSLYPKMKPIFALIEELSLSFLQGKIFEKGKITHTWIAMVDKSYQGKGLSTEIDIACTNLAAKKGYKFTYAEFTNELSEKITHHYPVSKQINVILYNDFTLHGQKVFAGVKGGSAAYILGIQPNITIDSLKDCYTTER